LTTVASQYIINDVIATAIYVTFPTFWTVSISSTSERCNVACHTMYCHYHTNEMTNINNTIVFAIHWYNLRILHLLQKLFHGKKSSKANNPQNMTSRRFMWRSQLTFAWHIDKQCANEIYAWAWQMHFVKYVLIYDSIFVEAYFRFTKKSNETGTNVDRTGASFVLWHSSVKQ
jgi:hypothetical protein